MDQQNMMMPNGMQPQQMNTMQRPDPGNQKQQIFAVIIERLRQAMSQVGSGWQTTFQVGQRATLVMEMVTQLRMLQPVTAIPSAIQIAVNFELRAIAGSSSREEYLVKMRAKQQEITQRRQEQVRNGQMGMQMPPNMNMPNNNMEGMPNISNMNAMNQANLMGMPNMQPGQNHGQQNQFLQHLQRQMQPSPLPPQHQQPPTTMDPSALQNPAMQPPMANMNQGNQQPVPNMVQGNQAPSVNIDQREVMQLVQQMMARMPDQAKSETRAKFMNSLNDQQRAEIQAKGRDPLLHHLVPRARAMIIKQRTDQQQQNGGMQPGNNQGMNGNMQQTPGMQNGGASIDYTSIMGQQANAMKQQESGSEVVPASTNPNMGMGGNMNMPQGINPAMLNQNGQQGNGGQISEQMRQMLMRQQAAQRTHQQNLMAQQQALQQAQQLRGQPGGLHAPNALNGAPAGQINSPAMPMLNKPLVPPGQGAPGTPQQNRPQPPPQTPMNGATQLLQHHQQMMQNNQNMNQGGQAPGQVQQRPVTNLEEMFKNQQFRDKLAQLDPQNRQIILDRLRQGQQPPNGGMNNMQPNQQGVPPNMNMGAPNQQNMMNGMPQNMQGSNIPQFNSQPPANQQPQPNPQRDQMAMQQRLQQTPQNVQIEQRAMDSRQYPKGVLQQLGLAVPEAVKVWGHLKQHIMANQPVIPPGTMERVQMMQKQWFGSHPDELNVAVQQFKHQMMLRQQQQAAQQAQGQAGPPQPQQPPGGGAPGMQMPNGQAPPAQMVPPTAPMQAPNQGAGMPPNMSQTPRPANHPQPITPQEVALFRESVGPRAANMNDEQLRGLLWQKRLTTFRNQQNVTQQEALRQAQMQRAQSQAGGNQQAQPRPAGQQQPQRPPQAQSQGQKRPQQGNDNDDVMEIPNPNAPPAAPMGGAPQAPPMQANQSQQQPANLPLPKGMAPGQLDALRRMPAEKRNNFLMMMQQKQQQEALKKAQAGFQNNQTPASQATGQQSLQPQAQPGLQPGADILPRVKIMYDEISRTTPKGPPVQISEQEREQAQGMLRRLWNPASRIHTTFPLAATIPNFENKLKAAMKAKVMLQQNIMNESGAIRDYLSLPPSRLREIEILMNSYFREVKVAKERMDAERAAQQVGGQAQGHAQQPPQAVANRKQQQIPQTSTPMGQTASQQGHARKASSNKAPPAPTDNNKTFDWGVASPSGIPKYDPSRPELTPDKLKFPPNKKRRTGQPDSQGSTPAAQAGTPGAAGSPAMGAKMQSPEQTRKSQQQVKQESEAEQKRFRCKDSHCENSIRGFESEEALQKHEEAEHKPVEDPFAFLLESAASALGVDQDGKPVVQKAADVKPQSRGTPAPANRAAAKREGQTPQIKQESTPASSGRAAAKAPATQVPEAQPKEKTMREVIEEKMGYDPAPSAAAIPDAPAPTTTAEDDVFDSILQTAFPGGEGGSFGGFDDWTNDFTNVDNWSLRPETGDWSSPELTPSESSRSSSDISQSERLRINFSWDPFGNGDTAVPEILQLQTLGIESASPEGARKEGEDTEMADAENTQQAAGKTNDGDWNWSEDLVDWDSMYGADAGLTSTEYNGAF